ncbi:MAG: glycosyltransferase [Lachnospiraceae bacterium]|nr:glycosyltransferase [Lachnospiraceae bacterium]
MRRVFGYIEKYLGFYRRNGLKRSLARGAEEISARRSDMIYNELVHRTRSARFSGRTKQSTQRDAVKRSALITGARKYSVIVPAYETNPDYLSRMIVSVLHQTWGNIELIIVDGSVSNTVCETVEAFRDPRIRYLRLSENLGISGNTNIALSKASGEYVLFVDHDDFIEHNAVEEIEKAVRDGAELVYTDEDKYDGARDRFFCPNRKPGYNKDLLLSNNYICHLTAVRTSLARRVGGFRSEFDGAQDYDFILRCTEEIGQTKIRHVPRVLYHWRVHPSSTAGNPSSKRYAYESGKRVLESYLERRSIKGEVKHTGHLGFYRIEYAPKDVPEGYVLFLDSRLIPLTEHYEKRMASYLAREDIGAVGARIIDRTGRIVSNGYTGDMNGKIRGKYCGMNRCFSGYMHRADMQQDIEAVSNRACLVRAELADCYQKNSWRMFEEIRAKGYLVLVDPEIVFKKT